MTDDDLISSVKRGREIVRFIAGCAIVWIVLRTILGLVVSIDIIREHGLNNPALFSRGLIIGLPALILLVAVLVFLGRGHEWARWLAVAWFTWKAWNLLVRAFTPGEAYWIAAAVLTGAIGGTLVFPRSVRAFYRFQRSGSRLDDA